MRIFKDNRESQGDCNVKVMMWGVNIEEWILKNEEWNSKVLIFND